MRTTKGADQPAHPRSLISTFVVRCLDSMICTLAISSVLKILARFCSWAGWFESYLVENPRRHFRVMWLNFAVLYDVSGVFLDKLFKLTESKKFKIIYLQELLPLSYCTLTSWPRHFCLPSLSLGWTLPHTGWRICHSLHHLEIPERYHTSWNFGTYRSEQIVQIKKEQSDQGLHCLPFPLHLLDT